MAKVWFFGEEKKNGVFDYWVEKFMKKTEKGASVNNGVGDFDAIWVLAEGRVLQRDPRKRRKKTEMMMPRLMAINYQSF